MTHAELNALCAEKVAHFKPYAHPFMKFKNGDAVMIQLPPSYCTDPAPVIALLEKDHYDVEIHFSQGCDMWSVRLLQRFTGKDSFSGKAESFAEAGVRALLKAHGCEVGE